MAKSIRKDTEKWVRIIRRTRRKIEETQKKQATRTRKQVYHKGYKLNDLVINKNHQISGGKLHNYYQGPYVVVGQTGPLTYRIREAANVGAKQEIQHYNELLPWQRQKLQHEMQWEDDMEDDPECACGVVVVVILDSECYLVMGTNIKNKDKYKTVKIR